MSTYRYVVSVQNDSHGDAGVGDEKSTKELREHHQCCTDSVNDYIPPYSRALSEISISCYVLAIHFDKRVHKWNGMYQHVEDP